MFGHLQDPGTFTGTPVPVATAEEVHTGQATILANVAGTEVEEYTVEILKVYSNTSDTRDLMLRVTDPRLLEKTGGIVGVKVVDGSEDLLLVTRAGILIRTPVEAIRTTGRATQGVIVMRFKEEGDSVISMALTEHEEDDEA